MHLFSLVIMLLSSSSLFAHFENVPFAELCGTHNELYNKTWRPSPFEENEFQRFDVKFRKNLDVLLNPGLLEPKIPKVLHAIWIGPKPFPEQSIANMASWKKYHPDWVFKFWTDSPERLCPIEGMEKHLIDEISFTRLKSFLAKTENYGEKSDLIRYEIIYDEGGIYLDHDIECFHSFDGLTQFDFFAGHRLIMPKAFFATRISMENYLFGAKPHHPILLKTMEAVEKRWDSVEKRYPGNDGTSVAYRVMHRTFYSLSLGIAHAEDIDGNVDLILPACFFDGFRIFNPENFEKLKEEGCAFACHYGAGSWVPEKGAKIIDVEKLERIKKALKRQKKRDREWMHEKPVVANGVDE